MTSLGVKVHFMRMLVPPLLRSNFFLSPTLNLRSVSLYAAASEGEDLEGWVACWSFISQPNFSTSFTSRTVMDKKRKRRSLQVLLFLKAIYKNRVNGVRRRWTEMSLWHLTRAKFCIAFLDSCMLIATAAHLLCCVLCCAPIKSQLVCKQPTCVVCSSLPLYQSYIK